MNLGQVVAPFIVGVIGVGFPVVIGFGSNLVQIIQLVVDDNIVVVPFIGQVAQAVVLIVAQILTLNSIYLVLLFGGTLHDLAIQNMPKLLPSTFQTMSSVLASMMGEDAEELLSAMPPADEVMFILYARVF